MSKLVGRRLNRFTQLARQAAAETRQARANAKAAKLAPVIAELRATGVTKLEAIAAAFNERGVPTPSGHRHAMQVARLLRRLPG